MREHLQELIASVEGTTDGVARKETEHCFVAVIADVNALKEASRIEHQEQYEIRTEPDHKDPQGVNGVIRVRAVDRKQYVLTTKIYYKARRGCTESEVETTKDMFNQFKAMAPTGHEKYRHYFPIEGSEAEWEVDVYIDDEGNYEPWVRMELEVGKLTDGIPDFPFEVKEFIDCAQSKMTDKEKKKVDGLYKSTFIKKLKSNFLPVAK